MNRSPWYKYALAAGALLLVALMPFHAFLATWLGSELGHRSLVQAWKEILIVLMSVAAVPAVLTESGRRILRRPVNLAALSYIILSLLTSLFNPTSPLAWLFGVKTNLVWVGLFIIVQLASHPALRRLVWKTIIFTSVPVAVLALAQAWVLPADWLAQFGYGPDTIRPAQYVDPAVPDLRAFSTLGGPNQLGAYLILPLCCVYASALKLRRYWQLPVLVLLLLAIFTTHSRSAWLGAIVGISLVTLLSIRRRQALWLSGGLAALALLAALSLPKILLLNDKAQYYLLHGSLRQTSYETSNALHIKSSLQGLAKTGERPQGHGLGTAGPASLHAGEGFITENYYLQLGVEVGLLGLLAFLVWQGLLVLRLLASKAAEIESRALIGVIGAISIINLFLHGWGDSSLALVFAVLAGLTIERSGDVPAKPVS